MPKLLFSLGQSLLLREGTDIPVQIRTPNLGLVHQTLSSHPVDLDPGKYVVMADSPNGRTVFSEVELGDHDQTIHLEDVEDSDVTAGECSTLLNEIQQFFTAVSRPPSGTVTARTTGNAVVADAAVRATTQGPQVMPPADEIKIEILSGVPNDETEFTNATITSKMQGFKTCGTDAIQFTAVAESDIPWLCVRGPDLNLAVALPLTSGERCEVVLKWSTNQSQNWPHYPCSPEIHFPNSLKELLLRGLERGHLRGAELAVNATIAAEAERYVADKFSDPVGAAIGAYVLLQFNDLKRLHNWTEHLMNSFPWLPDGAAIYGEHLALAGEHEAALEAFATLGGRIPVFSDGLSYVEQRLITYQKLEARGIPVRKNISATDLLRAYSEVSPTVDFSKAVVTRVLPPHVETKKAAAQA